MRPIRIYTQQLFQVFLCYFDVMIRYMLLCSLLSLSKLFAQPVFISGQTTGDYPHLDYGLGEDRLGGAKMTYLDTAVRLRVVDSVKSNYKVQLSTNHFAYLPKQYFRRDTAVFKPYHLTGSWHVSGDDKYDYVKIGLDERLPYTSRQEISPSRIVLDIFGATSNTNWITQLKTVKEIKNVYHEQIDDDVFRVIIELQHPTHWGYSVYYEGRRLVVRIKQQPPSLKLKHLKIAIDAGHGGSNTGAKGVQTGILEKDYTLLMAKALQEELTKKGADVFMIRSADTTLSMNERLSMAQGAQPDLLISIHLNSSGRASVKGTSTYYRYIGFRPLSTAVLDEMHKLGLADFGNVGSFNFTLNGATDFPNTLVEVAFLSNPEDEALIRDQRFQKNVGRQIRKGIEQWLKSIR